jgi:hypothetical protein
MKYVCRLAMRYVLYIYDISRLRVKAMHLKARHNVWHVGLSCAYSREWTVAGRPATAVCWIVYCNICSASVTRIHTNINSLSFGKIMLLLKHNLLHDSTFLGQLQTGSVTAVTTYTNMQWHTTLQYNVLYMKKNCEMKYVENFNFEWVLTL